MLNPSRGESVAIGDGTTLRPGMECWYWQDATCLGMDGGPVRFTCEGITVGDCINGPSVFARGRYIRAAFFAATAEACREVMARHVRETEEACLVRWNYCREWLARHGDGSRKTGA